MKASLSFNILFTIFICSALTLGGGGYSYPMQDAIIQVLAIAVLAFAGATMRGGRLPVLTWVVLALLLATIMLLAAQQLPVSTNWWRSVPVRQAAADVMTGAQLPTRHALSLAPDRTWRATLALLPPIAAVVGGLRASLDTRMLALRLIVAAAVAGTIIAAVQIAGGPDHPFTPYVTDHRGFGIGLFVNRNHQAAFLCAAIPLAAAPGVLPLHGRWRSEARLRWAVLAIVTALLSLGVLSTTSRAGLLLLPFAVTAALGAALLSQPSRAMAWRAGMAGVAVLLLAGLTLVQSRLAQTVIGRFAGADDDMRFAFWRNTEDAIAASIPWGTGFGSFSHVYPIFEPLDQVHPYIVNHAHNDVLEVVLEGGVPALLLMAGFVAWLTAATWLGVRGGVSPRRRSTTIACVSAIGLCLGASASDYPLRMTAIATMFGLLCSLLAAPSERRSPARSPAGRGSIGGTGCRVVLALGTLALAASSPRAGWGMHLLLTGQPRAATIWMPWSAQAWAALADDRQIADDVAGAATAARRALAISPIEAGAARVVGFSLIAQGKRAEGTALLTTAARLGWRDQFLQLWLAQSALDSGRDAVALRRIDAVLRTGVAQPEVFARLRQAIDDDATNQAMARELSTDPPWRAAFFASVGQDRLSPADAVIRLASRLTRLGRPIGGAEAAPLLQTLFAHGHFAELRRLRAAQGALPLLGDGDFAAAAPGPLTSTAAPYAWSAPAVFGVTAAVAEPEPGWRGQAALVSSEGSGSGPVLSQTLVLEPGTYRLSFAARIDPLQSQALLWRVNCPGGARRARGIAPAWRATSQGWLHGQGDFIVDDDCPAQTIAIVLRAAAATRIWIDDVALTRANRGAMRDR